MSIPGASSHMRRLTTISAISDGCRLMMTSTAPRHARQEAGTNLNGYSFFSMGCRMESWMHFSFAQAPSLFLGQTIPGTNLQSLGSAALVLANELLV